MTSATVAQALARFLKQKGVRHVFGLPGGENILVIEAIRQAGVEFVLMHHEACAGFAADVTGQLTNRPGVCLATVGPGAVNLLTTAAGATLERSPMLAITAEIDEEVQARVTHMKADLHGLFSRATKGSMNLSAKDATWKMETAWELAVSPPRGAVHLGITPATAAALPAGGLEAPKQRKTPDPDPADLEAARAVLEKAGKVFILAGVGVEAGAAQDDLVNLAEAWKAPVAVTPKAKGHFPEDHPLFTGCYSAYGDRPLRQALAESDTILGIGLDGVDFVTSTWDIATPVVNLNLAGANDPVTRPLVAVNGNLAGAVRAIRSARQPDMQGDMMAAQLRNAIADALDTKSTHQGGGIGLLALISALRRSLPENGAVTLDVGAFKLVFLQVWRADAPGSLFVANGLSAMGYALPGALAIKLHQPERPVVAVVGDGALLMYAGELETISRLGKPIVILVVVDQALALIRLKQLRHGVPAYGTEFGSTDYQSLARAFRLAYRRVEQKHDPGGTLLEAIHSEEPVLVEARVDLREYEHFR